VLLCLCGLAAEPLALAAEVSLRRFK
jgi:hypothetical protein